MKKLFLMLASMLLSLSIFASKEVAPTAADLANYYEPGQLCVAVYFEAEVCNDIVFVGTYNNWSTNLNELAYFQPLTGFDGWYVVAVTDESEEIWGKPVQLKSDGTFSWDFQTGDAASWTLLSGIVTIDQTYPGEADLRGYDKSAPVVMISSYFRNQRNPCRIVKHNYTVNLKAPICADAEDTYFAPAIIGDFNGWAEGVVMELNEETLTYSYTFEDEEGHAFKFKAFGDTDWTNQIQLYTYNEETGEYWWQDNTNVILDATEVIDIDYSAGRYTLCATSFSSERSTDFLKFNGIAEEERYDATALTAGTVLGSNESIEASVAFDDSYKTVNLKYEGYGWWEIDGVQVNAYADTLGLQGSTNPKDADGANPANACTVPSGGAVFAVSAKADGWLYIFHKASSNKQYMVEENSLPIGYHFGMVTTDANGYFGEAGARKVLEFTIEGNNELGQITDGRKLLYPEDYAKAEGDETIGTADYKRNGLGVIAVPCYKDCQYWFHSTGSKMSAVGVAYYPEEKDVYVLNEDGTKVKIYDTGKQIIPAIPGTTLPVQDFEDATANTQWTLLNGDQPNYWVIGNATAYQGAQSLYITNDGTSYGYNVNSYSAVWAILSTPVKGEVNISFDWKGEGEAYCDYMQVYLLPMGSSVYAGDGYTIPDGAIQLADRFNGPTAWEHYQGCASLGEAEYYLAFLWLNDASIGSTPVAIDNVQVNGLGQAFHYTVQAGENGALFNGNLSGTHTATCSHPTHTMYDICAYPYYGYKFTGWSDGITDQCRSITINRDTTITALFAPAEQVNLLVGIANGCDGMGSVSGSGTYYEQEWASIEATPNAGYHFVEWSDGNPDAQRDIYLTSDTTLFATFAPGYYGGKCGEHLYWAITNDTLVITGTGAMDIDNYTTWHNSTYDGYYTSFYFRGIVLPDGLTSIPAKAFYNYNMYNEYVMETVVIPASVEYIGHHAFASCYNLKKWQYLGNNLELGYPENDYENNYILANHHGRITFLQGPAALINGCGNYQSWYSLDTLILTNGYHGINNCPNLSYYDASAAYSDGYYYGYYRSNLLPYRTFFFPEDVVEIGDFALMNARYLGGVTIPAGVTRIGESAFEECRSLDSVVFAGNNLETIGDWAFYNCHGLKKINLPEGVQEVGKAAFFNCTYLSELTIPSTMQRIADNGFGACAKMQRMYVNALVPPAIEEKTFEDVDRSIPVFVPKGTLERYQGDRYWSEFFNITEYDAPTGILNASAQGEDNARKVLRNGQVLIIRGNQTYTVLGDKL